MVDHPDRQTLSCPDCGSSIPVEVPADRGVWQERIATCPRGHNVLYDERDLVDLAARAGR